jgi:hypothetical protein
MRGAAVPVPAAAAFRPRSGRSLHGIVPASGMPCVPTTVASTPTSPRGVITITTGWTLITVTQGTTRRETGSDRITTITKGTTRRDMSTRRHPITTITRGTIGHGTSTRRPTISTTPGTTRHGTHTTTTAAGRMRADHAITAATTTTTVVERTTTTRAEASRSDRFDALDVPHDPGALGLLRLHHACAGRERHLAELA